MDTFVDNIIFEKNTAKALGLFSTENTRKGLQKMIDSQNELINTILSSTDNDDEKRVYLVEDIQKILGISRTMAYALIKEAPFRVIRIGTAIRVSKADFDKWLDNPEQTKEG